MPLPRKVYSARHFQGMKYVTDTSDWDHSYVYRARNMVPINGTYVFRPGDEAWTVVATSALPQAEVVLRRADGTLIDVVAAGGELYTRNLGSMAWTKVITQAQLTGAGITFATGASANNVHAVVFNNQVVFSDGANTPFMWNGTSGAGLTKLANAPVAFGAPAVHYSKLFFVVASDPRTIQWSEENQPNTGYVAGGFNNQWVLGQTQEAAPLTAILGTNAGLYYWRRNSTGLIRGAVNADFSTAGVHDEVSSKIGTIAPKSVVFYNSFIWFVDARGRPWRCPLGGVPEPLWPQLEAFFSGTDAAGTGLAPFVMSDPARTAIKAAPYPGLEAVVFCYIAAVGGTPSRFFAFSADSAQLLGELDFSAFSGQSPVNLALGSNTEGGDDIPVLSITYTDGANCKQITTPRLPTDATPFAGTGTAYDVLFGPMGDGEGMFQWDELDVYVDLPPGSGTHPTITPAINSSEWLNNPDTSLTAVDCASFVSTSQHVKLNRSWGIGPELRFLQPRVAITTNPAGISRVDATAFVVPLEPGAT